MKENFKQNCLCINYRCLKFIKFDNSCTIRRQNYFLVLMLLCLNLKLLKELNYSLY